MNGLGIHSRHRTLRLQHCISKTRGRRSIAQHMMKTSNTLFCAICRCSRSSIPYREGVVGPTRQFHQVSSSRATLHPVTAHGPPPGAPTPSASGHGDRLDRRRRQAEMLQQGKEIRASQQSKPGSMLRKRFWKDVHVKEVEGLIQCASCLRVLKLTTSGRWVSRIPGHPTRPNPEQKHPHDPTIEASPGARYRARMGSAGVRTASAEAAFHPHDFHRVARRRYHTRRKPGILQNQRRPRPDGHAVPRYRHVTLLGAGAEHA